MRSFHTEGDRMASLKVLTFLPLPLEVLRPLGAPPAIGPPPRPVSRITAALFTDMEKFLCKHNGRGHSAGREGAPIIYCTCFLFSASETKRFAPFFLRWKIHRLALFFSLGK